MIQQSHFCVYIYTEEKKSEKKKRYMHSYVHSSIIYSSWGVEATKCMWIDGLMDKRKCAYTVEYYLALKKNEILSFAAIWMILEDTMLGEVN